MPVTVQNVSLLNGHMYALAVIDQNGNKAHANTPFYQTPSGIMLPAPSDALGNPITAAQGIAPTFTQNTGTIASTNTATSFTLALGSLAMGTGLYDARQATVRINNSGTAQTITQVQLVLQDNVGGATIPVTYTVGSLSIASGATDVFTIPLTSGLASTANLIVTFGTAPVAGEVYVSVNFQGAGSGQMSFTGSSATLPVKISDGGFTLTTLVNALAITTTTTQFLTYPIPVGMRSARKSLYVDSTLNQSITTLNFIPYLSSGRGPNGDSTAYTGATLQANNNIWIGNKEFPDIDSPFDMIMIEIGCTTAPTSGSVSIYLAGGR